MKDKKRKKSPKPNVDIGSALGFYLIFVFVRSWSFSNVGSTVALGIIRVQSFPPELDAAHRSAFAKAVSASPINLRAFTCLRKSEVRDHAGRLSESPNFLLPLMLKNSCGKLTHRAATIGAVGVFPAGKAGLMMCSSRERPLLFLTSAPISIHCGGGGKGKVFVYDGAANKMYEHSCCMETSINRFMTIFRFWWWMRNVSDVLFRAAGKASPPGVLKLFGSAAKS